MSFKKIILFVVTLLTAFSTSVTFATEAGSIVAWGNSWYGQCTVPSPNTDFTVIAAGSLHSLGLKTDGLIVAWGWNNDGQCNVPSPNTGFTAIACGYENSLGLKADGSIVAWGGNGVGQCNVPSPNTGFKAIAAMGSHSLGLKTDGSIEAWGFNRDGQSNVPSPNTGFKAIAAGSQFSLGLKTDGSIVVWGDNWNGQCNVPSPNTGFKAIAAGSYHSLGLKTDGSIVAWGLNSDGQCNVPSPNTGFKAIAAGSYHSLGLKADGSIVAWGGNVVGQCNVPSPNTGFKAIAAGQAHSLGLKEETQPSWSFVQISDTHIGSGTNARINLGAVLNKVLKEDKPAFIVNTGDVANRGCRIYTGECIGFADNVYYESYSQAVKLATDNNVRIFNIAGNHDQSTGVTYETPCLTFPSCFEDPCNNSMNWFMWNRSTFTDDENILFVVLNTGDGHCQGTLTTDDINFLKGLDKQVPKVILTHHPAVADDSEYGWIEDLFCDHGHIVEHQEDFIDYCEDAANNVYLVLSGHTHTNHVYDKDLGVPVGYPQYVITGNVGKTDYPVYRRINVASPPVAEDVIQLTEQDYNYMSAQLYSPAELHVYDSQGHHTGSDHIDGSEREIPNSVYFSHYVIESEGDYSVFPEEVLIFDPSDQYLYQVIGMEEATYKLKVTSVSAGEGVSFEAIGIPTSPTAKHVYIVDWSALSAGEEDAVVLEIDADGDGIPERTVIADEDLTSEEFALQTKTVIDFEPDTLNLRSPGKVVTAYIELPEGFDVSDIVISSLKLNDSVSALSKPVKIGDYDEDGIPDLMVKFDRQQVAEVLGSGTQMVTLTGRLSDGRPIAGIDFIRVIGGTEAEAVAPEFESTVPEGFIADMEDNLQTTTDDSVDIGGEDAFSVKEAAAFMLFEADGIIGELGPESFNNEESAFELACVINDVFTMLDEGMYFEAMVILDGDILERMDGYTNIGQPDEDDWVTSIEGQVLLYPLLTETIELLESML